ncbi:MAG: hypothetical protein ACI4U5_05645 [Bacilli bacterium]
MRKRMLKYIAYLEKLLEEEKDKNFWKKEKEEVKVQISFFQHERLVHLIVMALFALLEGIILPFAITFNHILIILAVALLVLLIPYISHYYFLENKTQYLYTLYDEVVKKCDEIKEGDENE